mgnify:FL=1
MNSRNGLVFLLLCLVMWTVYTEAITIIIGAGTRRRATKKPSIKPTPVTNAINNMIKNGVKSDPKMVDSIEKIMGGKGTVIFWKM